MPKKKEKPPKSREEVLSELIGMLAGLQHQLGTATHIQTAIERVRIVIGNAPPDLSPEQIKELENLQLWLERTERGIEPWKTKLEAMKPPLFDEANRIREARK